MDLPVIKACDQIKALKEAMIDASSIILMKRAGFFDPLANALTLFAPFEIIKETGFKELNINVLKAGAGQGTNDDKLILWALERNLALISEDKRVLMTMKRLERPYFNSLMMLNLLWQRGKINVKEHQAYERSLVSQARYSKMVLDFGDKVFQQLKLERTI